VERALVMWDTVASCVMIAMTASMNIQLMMVESFASVSQSPVTVKFCRGKKQRKKSSKLVTFLSLCIIRHMLLLLLTVFLELL